ncbi:hypothetical protein D5S17_06360 [Pseudonocardiaceae bacterium YIM PH 21723]|nr:hypothetical protein D5S17_06360 [Pseudonocardiaceae bacterium YIM PH 21723]
MSAVLGMVLLAGCSGGNDTAPKPSTTTAAASEVGQPGEPWRDDTKSAAAEGKVGGAGTPCALPVTFDLAKAWKPKAVAADTSSPLAGLTNQGGLSTRCEIDAKPAGNIGYLRVWAGAPATDKPRQLLEKFLAGEKNISGSQYREATVGGLPAAEVSYLKKSLDSTKKERALLVVTPAGPVLLHLGGLDSEEHDAMLPAYFLAKRSLSATA